MADRIAVNTNILSHDISQIDGTIHMLETISRGVYEDVNDLNGMWQGWAHFTLAIQFAQDYAFVKDTIIWLKNYKEELVNAQKEYDKAEQDISSLISRLR